MKFTLLSVVAIAAAASDSYAAPAASSLAGPVTTGIFSAVSAIPSFATNLSGQVASATSSVLSGNTASGSSATAAPSPSASGASSMQSMASSLSGSAFSPSSMMPIASGNMTMPNMTSSASASSAASTATGVAGGAGSNSSSSCAPTSLPASATELPTTVPTGTVITGDYTGSYRPQVHYSPPKGFMNDPNGCFRDTNGTYHLYYQYNPLEYVAGNQHWGHATSDDLYHWTNQPIAIFPPNSTSQVFSGSAVLDPNNTSGFFPNTTDGVVAVYTLNTPTLQVQEVAYSTDGGYNFTPYENNPVLSVGSNQFRDPKVFWYEDHWVMAVAAANDFTIEIYTSPNLTSWTFASNFTHHGLLGLAYECPNLVQVPFQDDPSQSAWLMYISINPGAPLGGSVGQYFPGDFNGTHFVAYDSAARIADFAKDNYASQWFADTENGESISIAWASNWQYTQQVPTGPDQGFRSAMSLPRRNYLTNITRLGWDLVSLPYDLSPVVGPSLLSSTEANSTADVDFTNVTSNAVWFSLNVTLPDAAIQNASLIAADASINITFLPSTKCSSSSGSGSDSPAATLTYFYAGLTNGALALTRPAASSSWGAENPFFTDKFSYTLVDPLTSLVGVFDRSMLEVFVNEGAHSATMLVFPDSPVGSMKVATGGLPEGTQVNLQVNGLESTWQSS